MCGLAGVFAPRGGLTVDSTERMLRSIASRGPDDSGVEVLSDRKVVLGHRRLAIIDLSPLGHQPMSFGGGAVWIVFNGEIYNFAEIRSDLEKCGCTFKSSSDTEVILAAYQQWGLSSVERFRGMFAFVIWDAERRQLHLVRDRFGVKPLYYTCRNGTLSFASELKALRAGGYTTPRINPIAVTEFLRYGYVTAPNTILEEACSVEPGTLVTFDEQLHGRVTRYWSLRDLFDSEATRSMRQRLEKLNDDELLNTVEDSLCEAFKYRMVSDVPVGLFLSGGIDSSIVAAVLARRAGFSLKTYTIGYGASEFDETRYARQVAEELGADHTEFVVSREEALRLNDDLPEVTDEPIGDSSIIPTLMVSKLARRHVTVALSADGADELFGGYARYNVCSAYAGRLGHPSQWAFFLSASLIDLLPPAFVSAAYKLTRWKRPGYAAINDKLRKFSRMSRAHTVFDAYDAAVSELSHGQCQQLYPQATSIARGVQTTFELSDGCSPQEHFMHFDAARYLPGDLLTKVDRASMAVSLEAREPCLDHELARLAIALPMRWKIRDGKGKYVLRRLLDRYFPSDLFERPKQGFSPPVGEWLRGPLRSHLLEELSEERVTATGVLDPSAVSNVVSGFLNGHSSTSAAAMWFILQLQRWTNRWLSH